MRKNLCIVILIMSILSACKKTLTPPISCASVSADSVLVGQTVSFTSCTKGATSYLWNFGDSTIANTDTTSHIYYIPGSYTATLITSNSGGKGTIDSFKIIVTAPESWTFKGVSYYGTTVTQPGELQATSVLNSSNNLQFMFLNYLYPMVSGIDTVTGFPSLPTEICLAVSVGNSVYISEQTPNSQTIQVTVFPNGKKNLVGNKILLFNKTNSSDTASVDFNLNY